jgi:predicted Zn-dependent protease
MIRDTEIEETLQLYGRPIFQYGGMVPEAVQIYLVADNSINAFTPGQNLMFFHTGLLMAAQNSNEVIGVLAHEAGHMVGGHSLTRGDQYAKAGTTAMLMTLLGVAAGVATGNPDVGMAMALGGQGTAMRQFLSYSRGQESQADIFALQALEGTQQSPQGMYSFFEKMKQEVLLISNNIDPYAISHPLPSERMITAAAAVERSPYTKTPLDPALEERHQRMVAKLFAFLKPQVTTLQRFPDTDNSVAGRYARSIAYYRRAHLDKALPLVDGLLAEEPHNPYFWELKGQMLFENGKIEDAIVAFREAVRLKPDASLIQVLMAHAMVESGDPAYTEETQGALGMALRRDPEDPFAWDLSAKSYAQAGNLGMSAYAASERALVTGNFPDVMRYTREAEKHLDRDTPAWYRLQDIKVAAQNYAEDMKNNRGR